MRLKAFGIAALAHAFAALSAAVGMVAVGNFGLHPLGTLFIAEVAALFALPAFAIAKLGMRLIGRDDVVVHSLGGAFAGWYAVSLVLQEPVRQPWVGLWGALAGAVYWTVRQLGRMMMKDSVA